LLRAGRERRRSHDRKQAGSRVSQWLV